MSALLPWYLIAVASAWSLTDIARDLRAIRRHLERERRERSRTP